MEQLVGLQRLAFAGQQFGARFEPFQRANREMTRLALGRIFSLSGRKKSEGFMQ
jgi:hypothetical protein